MPGTPRRCAGAVASRRSTPATRRRSPRCAAAASATRARSIRGSPPERRSRPSSSILSRRSATGSRAAAAAARAAAERRSGVHRLYLAGVLLGDRLALELHRGRQLVAARSPVPAQDGELLDLLDPRELRVGLVDRRLDRRADRVLLREILGRASPITAICPMIGPAPLSADSMFAGDMFLPAALMMISFLRSTILT